MPPPEYNETCFAECYDASGSSTAHHAVTGPIFDFYNNFWNVILKQLLKFKYYNNQILKPKCLKYGSDFLIAAHIARIARYNSLGWSIRPLCAVSWVCRILIGTERHDTSDIVPKN